MKTKLTILLLLFYVTVSGQLKTYPNNNLVVTSSSHSVGVMGAGGERPNGGTINLSIITTTDDSISLTWTNEPTNEDGFIISRSTDGILFSVIDSTIMDDTSYVDIGLTPYTIYYYKIKAYKGVVYSSYSNTDSDRTLYPFALRNNTVAWYDTARSMITLSGLNVTVINDKSINDHDLSQADTSKSPHWSDHGIVFDGINDYLTAGAFTYNQPCYIYMVVKQISFTNSDAIISGPGNVILRQRTTSPNISVYAGLNGAANTNLLINEYGIVRFFLNGATSKLQVNDAVAATGDFGSNNMGGIVIGSYFNYAANWCNMEFNEIIFRDTILAEDSIYNYLAKKYNIGNPLASIYVAPNGDDINNGSKDEPLLTLQRAVNISNPGDTIYIRDAIYQLTDDVTINKSGNDGSLINIFNYPNEHPVFDCTNTLSNTAIQLTDADYWHIKGIEIRNIPQPITGLSQGIGLLNSSNNIIEQVTVHDIGGFGITVLYSSNNNLILNCDIYNISDPLDPTPGTDADGIRISNTDIGDSNKVYGNRLWNISDDGIDCYYSDCKLYIKGNWSFNNGSLDGAGNGFKLGPQKTNITKDTTIFVFHNLSFYNKGAGFDNNDGRYTRLYYNNTSYHNGFRSFTDYDDTIPDIWKNNVSYVNSMEIGLDVGTSISEYNSWDELMGITLTDSDFLSIDTSGITGDRSADGSLPNLNFLKPSENSQLVNSGTDVGFINDYNGNLIIGSPDLGPFERQ